ncbi:unnamed protein product [Dibothriocephalus latus]|uniref:Uncharacterized protein n=1 Tax=Dibothriocephalus latus TaxID=60516 RepID=A0A3P7RP97_DIBLA|nr:unnamed protein product [Dibothriocephalus latus]
MGWFVDFVPVSAGTWDLGNRVLGRGTALLTSTSGGGDSRLDWVVSLFVPVVVLLRDRVLVPKDELNQESDPISLEVYAFSSQCYRAELGHVAAPLHERLHSAGHVYGSVFFFVTLGFVVLFVDESTLISPLTGFFGSFSTLVFSRVSVRPFPLLALLLLLLTLLESHLRRCGPKAPEVVLGRVLRELHSLFSTGGSDG